MKKEQFLANQKNKQQFIFMLSAELEKCNYKTFHAPADADSFWLFRKLFNLLLQVGDNTDLIVLLFYAYKSWFPYLLLSRAQKNAKKFPKKNLDKIFVITFFSFTVFLGASISKFKASSMFHEQAKVFDSNLASTNDAIDVGEKALVLIYNGKPPDNLDFFYWHKHFCEKVASKHLMLNRNHYHHLQQQQSTIASKSTFKCKNGKDQL